MPTLHMLCGKVASGKSTLAAELAAAAATVLISEDAWLSALYGDQMSSLSDYVQLSRKLRRAMGRHVVELLNNGVSVVLDFPANTPETRAWMREIIGQTDASHTLHVLMVSDEECLRRLKARNTGGEHPFSVTEEQFHRISQHFVPPSPEEGLSVVLHDR